MKVLVTGFEPFGGNAENTSWEAVRRLPDKIGEADICKLCLPVVFGEAGAILIRCMKVERPDAVISVGQADGREKITPERIAVNLRDARIPDNRGNQPQEEPVVPEGPDGIFATIPVKRIAEALRAAGIPAGVSGSAGTYVCNDVMYQALFGARELDVRPAAGFIHVPGLSAGENAPEEKRPAMELGCMVRGLVIVVEEVLNSMREAGAQ